jgi:predicted MFS family arabinose efflux permease
LTSAVGYAESRRQFGRLTGHFQSLPFRLSEHGVRIDTARLLTRAAAQDSERNVDTRLAAIQCAILIDAMTYLVSAVTLRFVRQTEPAPQPKTGPRESLLAQIGHGLRLAVKNTYLRALGIEATVYNMFNQILWAVLILHLARGLHFSPAVIGIVLTMSGVGALTGSMVAGRLSRRLGLGPALIASIVIANAAPLLIPLAAGGSVLTAIVIGAALLINGTGLTVYSIQAISVRQAAVTSDVLGRTNASYRFAVTGAAAIGAVIGGALGGWIGLRATILIGALGTLAAIWFVLRSPIPKVRNLSELMSDNGAMPAESAVPDGTRRSVTHL